ncbi:hypothetical protein ACH4E7_17230 [Kitasatospora sp. NPDC018058]|uniref:hypothetical protein n=1 Tax=Kitasatospora sp. NPDC018058 TaxID=3364025 RepID=UPI0037BFC973
MHVERRDRWLTRLSVSFLAVALITAVAYFGFCALTSGEVGKPSAVSCSDVMKFAGASMPAQATGASCTDTGGWMDRGYTAEFTMPQTDLAQRLTTAFPRVRLTGDRAEGLDFANSQETNEARPSGQAMFLELKATYTAGSTARVTLEAFNS